MKNEELDKINITNDIKKKSINVTWIIIGGKKKWIRKCPKCDKLLQYTTRGSRNRSRRNGSLCGLCSSNLQIKYNTPNTLERKCSMCDDVISYIGKQAKYHYLRAEKETRLCNSCSKTGKRSSMYGVRRFGHLNPMYGKIQSENAKRKMRIAAVKRILEISFRSKSGHLNNINPKETEYFSKLEKERGWNGVFFGKYPGQHIIDTLGYFVDYYEPTKNIVVEYDEPYHNKPLQKIKDTKRQNEIINELKCDFYRFNESTNQLIRIQP